MWAQVSPAALIRPPPPPHTHNRCPWPVAPLAVLKVWMLHLGLQVWNQWRPSRPPRSYLDAGAGVL